MKNCGNFSIFLWVAVNELRLTEKKKEKKKERKNKMDIFSAGLLDRTKDQANFEGNFAIHE